MTPLFKKIEGPKKINNMIDALGFLEVKSDYSSVESDHEKLESTAVIPQMIANTLDIKLHCFSDLSSKNEMPEDGHHDIQEMGQAVNEQDSMLAEDVHRELENEKNAILQNAKEEADAYIAQAHIQAQIIKDEIYTKTEQEVREIIYKEVEARFEAIFLNLDKTLDEAVQLRAKIIQDAEADIASLSFCLARKIIQQEVRCNREIVVNSLRQALKHLVKDDHVIIRINSLELAHIQACRSQIAAAFPPTTELVIQGDDTVGPGGCLIETDFGRVDARIESQLQEVTAQFYAQAGLGGTTA